MEEYIDFSSPLLSPSPELNPFDQGDIVVSLNSRYEVVREVLETKMGFISTKDPEDKDFTLYWQDKSTSSERVKNLQSYQVINHFPSMLEIARRTLFVNNYELIQNVFPEAFDFHPPCIRSSEASENGEEQEGENETNIGTSDGRKKSFKRKVYIVKPNSKRGASGIFLTCNIEGEPIKYRIIQEYISNPLLMEKKKFDLRFYILITSLSPLSIYLCKNGFVRLAEEEYKSPYLSPGILDPTIFGWSSTTSPLNRKYAITVPQSTYFSHEETKDDLRKKDGMFGTGRVRDFQFLRKWMNETKNILFDEIFDSIGEMLVKTVLVGYERLLQAYKKAIDENGKSGSSFTCFELLGADVLIDENLKPHLLDICHSPTFFVYCEAGREIKSKVLEEAMKIVDLDDGTRVDRSIEDYERERQRKVFSETKSDEYRRNFPDCEVRIEIQTSFGTCQSRIRCETVLRIG